MFPILRWAQFSMGEFMDTADKTVRARQKMVDKQLRRRRIQTPSVLTAMQRVPRERCLPLELADWAYADRALSIDCGQTISQPYMVALMTDALDVGPSDRVLEIGTGSGYQTAVLAELAGEVLSIERHAALSERAGAVLRDLGYKNVRLLVGDGTLGYPAEAPYTRILVTAAAGQVPPALCEQLAEGGILVMPVGDLQGQVLQVLRKLQGQLQTAELSPCRFVPLIGSQGVDE